MAHNHDHDEIGGKRLLIALFLNLGITLAQVIGGIVSGSLSLLGDAAHNGSDAAALGIAYGAQRIARRRADRDRTFGYERAETIGALINLTVLFVIAVVLAYQAASRLVSPTEVEGTTMLIVGAIAFVEDLVSVIILYKSAHRSLNVRAATIHLIGDTAATVGVMAGGLLIMFYGIYWVDPAITALIAVYIFAHSFAEIRTAIRILMESAPKDFEFDRMVREVESLSGVVNMHHVHVWRLDEHRVALEAHVAVLERDLRQIEAIKRRIKDLLRDDFGIVHATLEIEVTGLSDHGQSVIPDG